MLHDEKIEKKDLAASCEKESVIQYEQAYICMSDSKASWIICSLHITSWAYYTEGTGEMQALSER